MTTATLINGFIIGWSVAWPPGPINAEMLRRTLLPRAQGGGFWNAWQLGLGACTGDFLWALAVMTGAGALLNTPRIRLLLGVVSFVLLLLLAAMFARNAWKSARKSKSGIEGEVPQAKQKKYGGYFLGLVIALTSPWNLGFWLAVIGGQQMVAGDSGFTNSLAFAGCVVLGATAWTLVFSIAIRQGARIFARPAWQAATQAITSLLMLFFAARLLTSLHFW
ncbi:MAG TPA: LysE family transporter [Chthoniobacterales bacterium]|nr:LysE family transporter [Chthoniobacterales bacterium]